MEKKRIIWVDYLRIFATLGVIIMHWVIRSESLPFFENIEYGKLRWIGMIILRYAFMFCVPVFLMLSGALTLDKEISLEKILLKKIPKVFFMRIASFVLCGIAGAFYAVVLSLPILSTAMGTANEWGFGSGFFAVLGGCYAVTPFLTKIVKDKKMEIYFLVLGGVVNFIVPPFVDVVEINSRMPGPLNNIVSFADYSMILIPAGAVYYFVIGHFLLRIIDYISVKLSIAMLVLGTTFYNGLVLFNESENCNSLIVKGLLYGRYYGGYVSIPVMIYAASVFVFFAVCFKNIQLSEKKCNVVSHMGRNSIMIFILHGIIIAILRPIIPDFGISFVAETLINSLICFAIAYIFSLVFEHVPGIRRLY